MQNHFGVFRSGDFMKEGVPVHLERTSEQHLPGKSATFIQRIEALELQNLFEVAEATAIG